MHRVETFQAVLQNPVLYFTNLCIMFYKIMYPGNPMNYWSIYLGYFFLYLRPWCMYTHKDSTIRSICTGSGCVIEIHTLSIYYWSGTVWNLASRGHFKNTYELLNPKALKISIWYQKHIFQCMGKIFSAPPTELWGTIGLDLNCLLVHPSITPLWFPCISRQTA